MSRPRPGPQRDPDRDLPLPLGAPHEKKAGDVCRSDREHEGDRAEKKPERVADVTHDRVEKRRDHDRHLPVLLGVFAAEARRNRGQLRAGIGQVDLGCEAPYDIRLEMPIVAPIRVDCDPDDVGIYVGRVIESARKHTHDAERFV